jgi:hypothetical protein
MLAVVVLDTVTFQYHGLKILEKTPEECIIHCLQVLVKAVQADKSLDSTNEQMLAVESL